MVSAVTLPGAERDRIAPFDGVRALAFSVTYLHHALQTPLLWIGVDQFFVLSGFLITRNLMMLLDKNTTASALSVFSFRRLLRIVPPYCAALTLMLLLAPAFALVILAAPLFRWLFTPNGWVAVYTLTPCRMDLLAFGALFAMVDVRDATRKALNSPVFNLVGYSLVAVIFAMVLAYARGLTGGRVYRALMHPWLQYLGKISYMAYLLHWFCLDLLARLPLGTHARVALAFPLTVLLASVSWYGLERPLQRLRGRVQLQRRAGVA